jgi:hypothetical protein
MQAQGKGLGRFDSVDKVFARGNKGGCVPLQTPKRQGLGQRIAHRWPAEKRGNWGAVFHLTSIGLP